MKKGLVIKKSALAVLDAVVPKKERWRVKLAASWPDLVGATLVPLVELQGTVGGKVFLLVKNACLSNELFLQKNSLLSKFNSFLGGAFVEEIVIRTGSRNSQFVKHKTLRKGQAKGSLAMTSKKENVFATLSSKQDQMLAKVKCPFLKNLLKGLLRISQKKSSDSHCLKEGPSSF